MLSPSTRSSFERIEAFPQKARTPVALTADESRFDVHSKILELLGVNGESDIPELLEKMSDDGMVDMTALIVSTAIKELLSQRQIRTVKTQAGEAKRYALLNDRQLETERLEIAFPALFEKKAPTAEVKRDSYDTPSSIGARDPIRLYLAQAAASHLLTFEEEFECALTIQENKTRWHQEMFGSPFIRDEMVHVLQEVLHGNIIIARSIDVTMSNGDIHAEVTAKVKKLVPHLSSLMDDLRHAQEADDPDVKFIEQCTSKINAILLELPLRQKVLNEILWQFDVAEQIYKPDQFEAAMGESVQQYKKRKRRIHDSQETFKAARNKLAMGNTRLVVSIAKKYRYTGIPFLDLIQEGNAGLMMAVDKFKPELGNKFCTYATWWIRQNISRMRADLGLAVRVPVHMHQIAASVYKFESTFKMEHGRSPTDEEIISQFELSEEDFKRIKAASMRSSSYDAPVGESQEESIGNLLHDERVQDVSNNAEVMMVREAIALAMRTLPKQWQRILNIRNGLGWNFDEGESRKAVFDEEKYGLQGTLEEVAFRAAELGLTEEGETMTRERIRQIEVRVMERFFSPNHPLRRPFLKIMKRKWEMGELLEVEEKMTIDPTLSKEEKKRERMIQGERRSFRKKFNASNTVKVWTDESLEDCPPDTRTLPLDNNPDNPYLNDTLAEMDLPVRVFNVLDKKGVYFVRDLLFLTDQTLMNIEAFGETSMKWIDENLAKCGLKRLRATPQELAKANKPVVKKS